jgi:D-alanyl-D-alanine carboxypeptidase
MGLVNTHFVNPHGLDQAGHYSSARDLAEIARAVMSDPTLSRIVSTRRYVVPGPPLYVFVNSNPLLGAYPGVDGVKTGFTDDAGRCYAGTFVRDGRRVITVVLNSPNIAADGQAMLETGFTAARPVVTDAQRIGFAGVRSGVASGSGRTPFNAAGWELAFLRAFTRTPASESAETRISLLGRPLGQWSP